MANTMFDRVPHALKSMFYTENELRRALFKGVVLRTDQRLDANPQAMRHIKPLIAAIRA